MTLFQLIMLGASAFFALKIYEHIQTLQDSQKNTQDNQSGVSFDVESLIDDADKARERGEYSRALAIYSEAKQKAPNNAEVLFKMGYTMSLEKRDDEALEYYLDSLKFDDENPFAYKEIAKIYEKKGEDEKADYYNKKAAELDENI